MRQAVSKGLLILILLTGMVGMEWARRYRVEHDLAGARVARDTGRLTTARQLLRRAAWLAPGAPEPRLALAELELMRGNYTVVRTMLEALSDESLAAGLQARVVMAMARVHFFRGRLEQAKRSSRHALAVAETSGDPELEARALLVDTAIWLEESPDMGPALAALERARRLAAEGGHELLRAHAETEIGQVLWWYLRQVDDPVPEYFAPALEVFQRHGDTVGEAHVLDRIGMFQMRADDLVAFFETQERALKLWEDAGNRARQSEGHFLLSWAWDRLENPRRSHHHSERAERLARDSGADLLLARAQRYIAAAEHSSGRSERAITRLERWLAEPRPRSPEDRYIYCLLGDARRRLGKWAAARAAYAHARELDRVKDAPFRIWVGSGQARTALAEGDLPRARQLLSELEGLVGPRSDWSDRRRVLLLRAQVLEADSEPASALATLLDAAEIETRSLGSVGVLTVDYGLGVLRRLLPRLLDPDRFFDQLAQASSGDDPQDLWATAAFRLLEQARLRPVRQKQLAGLGHAQADEAALTREGEALIAAREAATLAAASTSPGKLTRLRDAYAHYEEQVFRARSAGGLISGGRAATVAEIRQRLSPRTAIVTYVLTRKIAVALVLRNDRFDVVPLGIKPADLRPRIKILRHQLAAGHGEGWRSPARELGRLLLDPVEASGGLEGSEHLLVVPMAELHEVPFAALLDAAGRPLAEKMAISMLPAASVLLDSSPRLGGTTVVVARESFGALGLPDLPAARREAEAVAGLSNATQLVSAALTERAFRGQAAGASRLHIVTHARVEPEMPMLSRLILAPPEGSGDSAADGELSVRELLELELRAELVTLSACQSGLALPATRRPNVELRRTGLVEGFLLAGARNVLGTLFPVEDAATADFMIAFEEELGRRQPIDALAAVQRAVLAGDGPTAHPGHWSAFVLNGPGTWSGGR